MLDCPRSIGKWAINRVYIDVLYPDNTTKEVDCTRTGNVWVGTFEGSTIAGKVSQGYQIKADGVDENENPITGYVLGCGDVYILDDTNDIKALVGKTALRMLDDIPATPAKGDVVIVNGALKIYDGEEWYTVEVDLSNYYTKSEIDEKVAEIDSSISALGDEIPTKTSDLTNDSGYLTSTSTTITDIQDDVDVVESSVSNLNTTVGELENSLAGVESSVSNLESSMTELESSMTSLESSMTELESTMSGLDGLAVKYDDANKTGVHLGVDGRAFTLNIPDNFAGNGKIQFRGVNHISRNTMTLGVADTGETVGDTHVQLGDSHAPQAQVDIGANVQIMSFNEEGKSQILIDGERLVVVTPNDVAEGKTLVASYVPDTPINSLSSTRKGETMTNRDNPEGHWEYVSADLPSKTSDLTNDSGFVNSTYVDQNAKSAWRTWEYEPDGLMFRAEEANSTVAMQKNGSVTVSLEYTTDGSTWQDFIVGTTTVTLANAGDWMALRAKTTNTRMSSSESSYNTFVMTGKIAASGSIMYLLKNDGDLDTISSDYCFCRLFRDCTSLTKAPELPATISAYGCYRAMFWGCTSLT